MIRPRTNPRPGRLKGADLEALRDACWVRDKGFCQYCGIPTEVWRDHTHDRSYHMAHIKAKRMGGDNLDNVRTLCGKCHRREHQWGKSMEKPCPSKMPEW